MANSLEELEQKAIEIYKAAKEGGAWNLVGLSDNEIIEMAKKHAKSVWERNNSNTFKEQA